MSIKVKDTYVRNENGQLVKVPFVEGVSAYDSAVIGGYTGTETQFYQDLADATTKEYVDEEINEVKFRLDTIEDEIKKPTTKELLRPYFAVGTLLSTTGTMDNLDTRCTLTKMLKISNFSTLSFESDIKALYMIYDSKGIFIANSSSGWKTSEVIFSKESILARGIEGATYIRFAFCYTNNAKCNPETMWNKITIGDYNFDDENTVSTEYVGNKVVIKNKVAFSFVGNLCSGTQSMVIAKGRIFQLRADGSIRVCDGDNYALVSKGTLGSIETIVPHCNSTTFGHYYNSSDTFPLLYTNAYNNTGLPKGTCYVHRIQGNDIDGYTTTLLQTITIGFTSDSLWTDGAGDNRPYGNFAVDTDTNSLYVYTLLNTTRVTRIFKFALPDISNASVTLNTTDIIDHFDIPYLPIIQDNCFNNGHLIITNGPDNNDGNVARITFVNCATKTVDSTIDMADLGLNNEMEGIDVVNNKLLLVFQNGAAYQLDF